MDEDEDLLFEIARAVAKQRGYADFFDWPEKRQKELGLPDPAKARRVSEAFVVWLDRLDDEYKAELLAKVFELYGRGVIDFDRASRFAAVIERGHLPYLFRLRQPQASYPGTPHFQEYEDLRSHLLALGLMNVRADLNEVDRQLDRDVRRDNVSLVKFELNDDGRVFKE